MNASRIGAIVLRMFYLYRGSPQRVFPIFIFVAIDILVWGFLTRYLNSVSHADFNFVPALLGAVLLVGFSDPRDAANHDDVVRGRLDAKFPQFVRLALEHVRISGRAPHRRDHHERAEPDRHARARANRVRVILCRLWRGARPFPHGAVRHRHRARRRRLGLGAEARAGLRMAHLADPDADLAVRGRFLPSDSFARMDAGDRADPAAVLRV